MSRLTPERESPSLEKESEESEDESENQIIRQVSRKPAGRCASRVQLATTSTVSPAPSSENFQAANPVVSQENTSLAQTLQEIKKDFEEADAALLKARHEGKERRIRFFEIAYDVLIEELESIRKN